MKLVAEPLGDRSHTASRLLSSLDDGASRTQLSEEFCARKAMLDCDQGKSIAGFTRIACVDMRLLKSSIACI